MTTPNEMRTLADAAANLTVDNDWDATVIADVISSLRDTADQLEAVREWAELELEGEQPNEYQRGYQMAAAHARRFVVTADTAPQEESAAEKLRSIATTYDVDKMLRAIKAGE